jgi:hypothetical protein
MGNYLQMLKYMGDERVSEEIRSLIRLHLQDIRIFAYRNMLKS